MLKSKNSFDEKQIKLLLAIILAVVILFFGINHYRYGVSAPMQDIAYKKDIVRHSHNLFYRVENLRNLVGENELTEFIKSNDDNPELYTASLENRKNGVYRATLHMHTTNSDGASTVKHYLDLAQTYATQRNFSRNDFVYIAITDHNTILGAKELVQLLQKSAKKYPNVKVIAGMEINSKLYSTTVSNDPVEIHTLVWCIDPYNKYLNKVFYKKDLKDKMNMPDKEPDFEGLVYTMSDYGIPGIAHPATYSDHLGDSKFGHIVELFDKYKSVTKKIPFVEGFYQTYPAKYYAQDNEFSDYYEFIKKTAKEKGIMRTGSTDSHGHSIFSRL